LPFPLLSDTRREIALAYAACESARDEFPRRITYVIGADGRIEQAIETRSPGSQAGELADEL
jgi:peroxiredoxin